MVLADYAHPETAEAFPSVDLLAVDCEMSRRNMIRCINELEERRFISRVRRGNQHRPSVYRLHLVSHAPIDEGDTQASDKMSPAGEGASYDRVHVTSETSVSDTSDTIGVQEELTEESTTYDGIRWLDILAEDHRWQRPRRKYIQDVLTRYGNVDLTMEAHACFEWLQSPKGKNVINPRRVWLNWLARVGNGRGPSLHEKRLRNEQEADNGKRAEVI